MPPGEFVPNDTALGPDDGTILLITGPNMAGKSTYIRQVALIAILAQIGSFVPAKRARIGVVDRLFARVGATDELSRGQSTFMVEMTETANILNNATAAQPGHPRRDRPRHQHLRRHLARLGDHRAPARRASAAGPSSPRTTTSWSSWRRPSPGSATRTSRSARARARSSSSTGSSPAAPTRATASTSPGWPACPAPVLDRAREILAFLEKQHGPDPGPPAGPIRRRSRPAAPSRAASSPPCPTPSSRSSAGSTSTAQPRTGPRPGAAAARWSRGFTIGLHPRERRSPERHPRRDRMIRRSAFRACVVDADRSPGFHPGLHSAGPLGRELGARSMPCFGLKGPGISAQGESLGLGISPPALRAGRPAGGSVHPGLKGRRISARGETLGSIVAMRRLGPERGRVTARVRLRAAAGI